MAKVTTNISSKQNLILTIANHLVINIPLLPKAHMTDNTQVTTNTALHKTVPKYRKRLNLEQVAVLQMLYRFRFASSEQVAKFQEKPGSKAVQKRLKILEDQGLISKRYDKTYKLKGKPAAYHLTPTGARALEANAPRESDEPINIKRLYKDKDVSEGFIEHCMYLSCA